MAGQEFNERAIRRSVIPAVARTSHPAEIDIPLAFDTGCVVHIALEAITGTSITVSLYAVHPVTGRVTTAAVLASAGLTAAGYTTLTIAPGVATVSNVSLQAVAPRILRIIITGTITSYTVDVSVESFAV